MDAIADGRDLSNIGTRTILPATFTGGPREMHQQYHSHLDRLKSSLDTLLEALE